MTLRTLALGLFLPLQVFAQSLITPFERDSGHTATYEEANHFYQSLAERNKRLKELKHLGARYFSIGKSDGGLDINVFALNSWRGKSTMLRKPVLLINNAIHPGEPEGVDASMMLMRDILEHQEAWNELLRTYTVYVISQYNVDGVRNRGCCSRANQHGPDEYGFRGNARNLDLNRDFIKADSRNAQAFIRFFTEVEPDLFIDNHTSNGADYQYTLTYFASHPAKLDPALRHWLNELKPKLDTSLNRAGWKVCPYVETRSEVPDSGIVGFFETGRYATGFAALHHCLGFTVETHMLKPFPQRVRANYDFMREFMKLIPDDVHFNKIGANTPADRTGHNKPGSMAHLRWKLNQHATDSILFHGYEAVRIPSDVTGYKRLAYLRNRPFSKIVPYYNEYTPVDSVSVPFAYVIPQAWHEVIERLQWNGMKLGRFQEERLLEAEVSYIESWESLRSPYEGHFLHHTVKTRDTIMPVRVFPGDYWVAVTQKNAQFLVSVLSARAPDSYFSWNFFDGILQQKEGYSAYVFEDVASRLLKEDRTLAEAFALRKSHDPLFAADPQAQLNWIYRKSAYYEPTHRLYPVYRIIGEGLKEANQEP